MDVILRRLEFGGVVVHCEALAATFTHGVTGACVVGLGAQSTSVVVVDEGAIVPNTRCSQAHGWSLHNESVGRINRIKDPVREGVDPFGCRVLLPYGGDDVCAALQWLLQRTGRWPAAGALRPSGVHDMVSLNALKEQNCFFWLEGARRFGAASSCYYQNY